MDHKLSVNILMFDVRIAFPPGLARSYLDFLLSFDYPLRVLIRLNVIANASRTSGIFNLSTGNIDHENKLH